MAYGKSVAIVAMGGEFPDAQNLKEYWQTIISNRTSSRQPPPGRWLLPPDSILDSRPGIADRIYSDRGCFLADAFDTATIPGLDIEPDFLRQLDPMFRLLLRVGQQTLTSASGVSFDRARAGVIIGNLALPTELSSALSRDILGQLFSEQLSSRSLPLGQPPVSPVNHYVAGLPAALLAKALKFGGACFTLDAACASSLYALKLAMDELLSGRADAMLAGGLSRPDSLYTQMGFSQLRALSATGVCAPFDRKGNGLVVGEGCGLMLLKRTRDAVRDGDHILAVIRGIGLSNDQQGNLLAPASEGQLRAMRAAYQQAGWHPADVDLVECHATGTPVGDAVEFSSLRTLWGASGWRAGQCVIGSVKGNIGHLLTAAGAAATIKTVLAMQHTTLPPMPNFNEPAPGISLEDSPFKILGRPDPWEPRKGKAPRRAAVSAFGFGGINAHLLLEEWLPERAANKAVTLHPVFSQKQPPIAVVGMAAEFGSWAGIQAYQRRIFGGDQQRAPQPPERWWGAENSAWSQQQFPKGAPDGYFVPQVAATTGQFRIPPTEQQEMLPRQLLMLKIAAEALADAGALGEDHLFTGVFIGCGLDLNATNFSFRWGLAEYAERWAQELGLTLTAEELTAWVDALRAAAGPALTANRTMGALGSIVASRIAKEFGIGGPSFTLSSEENSGLRALEVGIHALQEGSINRAIVGAVDLAGDLRAVAGRYHLCNSANNPTSSTELDKLLVGEGAGALVLKRLDDARQDGDRIHAVISGVGTSIGGAVSSFCPDQHSYNVALKRSCQSAGIELADLDYIELAGCDDSDLDKLTAAAAGYPLSTEEASPICRLGSVRYDIGHAGHASGMAALIKTILCLEQRLLPPVRSGSFLSPERGVAESRFVVPHAPQYWLVNRKNSPRRALVAATGHDGSCSGVILEEAPQNLSLSGTRRPTGELAAGLFVLRGATAKELLSQLNHLKKLASTAATGIDGLARQWYQQTQSLPQAGHCMAVVAQQALELLDLLQTADSWLRQGVDPGADVRPPLPPAVRDRIFYSAYPLAQQGKVAFVFPGSGNHFSGMGRDFSAHWPQIYARQEEQSQWLADQYRPEIFWNGDLPESVYEDHNALVISHVALCTALHDLIRCFGIKPQQISGYSLGESSGLFSSGAWRDRDAMLERLAESTLFTQELAGECRAARRIWGLPAVEKIDWLLGIVNVSAARVKQLLHGRSKVYLLIVNTYKECVIGGQRQQVEAVVRELGCHFIPLRGVTTVHCEVTKAVADAYRKLHLFEVSAPKGIDFYSCALARKYPLTSTNAADAILAQALDTIDYPKVVEQLYTDGARIFIEVGPGSSCSRMISSILGERPHLARSFCAPGQDAIVQLLRLLGHCLAEGVAVDLDLLYRPDEVSRHQTTEKQPDIYTTIGGRGFKPALPVHATVTQAAPIITHTTTLLQQDPDDVEVTAASSPSVAAAFRASVDGYADAHAAYLNFSRTVEASLTEMIRFQFDLLRQGATVAPLETGKLSSVPDQKPLLSPSSAVSELPFAQPAPLFDRDMCMEFAIGSVATMLGPDFAEVDTFPTRVRLPDEPLMLVDRIVALEGEPRSMNSGRVVTEHDVTADRWYLDGGRIPTCVAVEAGQADLFLSGYLGIDFITRGKAVYRLLDAVVTFHRGLPVVGDTIRYDIRIEKFFRQDQTYLFRFHFESSVNGEPLLSMRNGCAGFFSEAELAAGKGIVHTRLDLLPQAGKLPDDWRPLVTMQVESYSDEQISALYEGDLVRCFGSQFKQLPLQHPYTLPGGKLKLVDRVVQLDPVGGRYGLGQIVAEMDIRPDAWFLTCHFVDDQVMPGTLMYECCMHTLRIFLLRMGWIGEEGSTWCEPVPGVDSGLKCRGQVIATTKKVTYQVSIKELGYRPQPYAIVDALMFADDHPIVEIPDMSVQLSGLTKTAVEGLWTGSSRSAVPGKKQVLYDTDKITAFAIGHPSEAFGEPYRIFDQQRKIARLPGPPFQFLDRIVAINGEPWKLVEGVTIEAEYEVPADAWYFSAGRQPYMPFSVLLEIGLQPCGWLAAYLGSALTSATDLSFRNLDGQAVQHRMVTPASGTLTTAVEITRIASSGGMIIQGYSFEVSDAEGPVYTGTTVFGFFSASALAQQVGVRGADPYQVTDAEMLQGRSFVYPQGAPYPDTQLRMVDQIDLFVPQGGPAQLGFIRGSKRVDPDEWFFKAHFYQDPVCPGSLGLESFLQLLKIVAAERWGATSESVFETIAAGQEHRWNYRGQIIPSNRNIGIEALVTAVDDGQKTLWADGLLLVDGKVIYQMHQFSLRMSP